MLKYIKTNLSKAYWCTYGSRTRTEFESAFVPIHGVQNFKEFYDILDTDDDKKDVSRNDISWFDNMFDGGGLLISDLSKRPITLLITGPPGSGKTTLALEFCLRVAITHGLWSLYISTESDTDLLIKKLNSFKIKNSKGRILKFTDELEKERETLDALTIYGRDKIKTTGPITEILNAALKDALSWITGTESKLAEKLLKNRPGLPETFPNILVIDSLNMLAGHDEREEYFRQILDKSSVDTKLIIIILDSSRQGFDYENWEFACDNIIRLDYDLIRLDSTAMRDYYIRYIEVVKARYQAHVWGKQQMKIYTAYELPDRENRDYDSIMRRAHPYRSEGGIFIYPSIHYFLSKYKRSGTKIEISTVPTPCQGLNEVIEGFPKGRCTALMGIRGGHKSHLGYLHILDQIVSGYEFGEHNNRGLIVSLRDDEQMTKRHLLRILKEELYLKKHKNVLYSTLDDEKKRRLEQDADTLLDRLIKDDLLEILYYPPGYITPDEFFHRMFMSIYRFKYRNKAASVRNEANETGITVLFNSLDQLSARFPLCAHQPIFIPAMIQSLSGEDVTSIFIAVDEPGQPPTQYGLLPMADLILSFGRYKIREQDYATLHNRKMEPGVDDKKGYKDAIILEVARFSGGQKAGTRGLLELVYSDKYSDESFLKDKPGLHFHKWQYEYFLQKDVQTHT